MCCRCSCSSSRPARARSFACFAVLRRPGHPDVLDQGSTPDREALRLPIKTLHITNSYHPTSGGIRTFYRALLEASNSHERHVRLVVPGVEDSVEEIGAYGKIYTIAAPASPVFDSRYHLLLPHLYASPYASPLRRILLREQPDLVEVCDKFALCCLPVAMRRNWIEGLAPAVTVGLSCERLDDNVSAYVSSSPLGRQIAGWYMKTVYAPRFDCHIANSDYTAGELRQALANHPEIEVHVRPMGVDCRSFSLAHRSEAARAEVTRSIAGAGGLPLNARLLLYVGRLSPEKNLEILVDMMSILSATNADDRATEYHLLLAGDGPQASWLKKIANLKAPGRIHFLGHIGDRRRLADLYANSDALVHPNAREPFGIAPLEAMASGLLVVAPRAGGVLSYASDENAWLAEPSAEGFANAVRCVFANEVATKVKAARAQQTAAGLDWPLAVASFFKLYDELYRRFRKFRSKNEVVQASACGG